MVMRINAQMTRHYNVSELPNRKVTQPPSPGVSTTEVEGGFL